jgi:predicted nucleotidyltransferase component of viral defense system
MLRWNTVSPLLASVLRDLMQQDAFQNFRLVGGTALSLHLGHRMSTDIDLFSDQEYGTIRFDELENYLSSSYRYFNKSNSGLIGVGNSYLVGKNENDSIKLDIYYTDTFIRPPQIEDGVRLATVEEIAAMKIDVIQRGGRKKDFWDIHEILDTHRIKDLLALHQERHPYTHNEKEIRAQLVNFDEADNDFDPICLKNKIWELVKYDILQTLRSL